jgi:hypothetical protein
MKQVIFWGTRGSLPTSITHANIRAKISSALLAANGRSFRKQAELDAFVDRCRLPCNGTFGGNSSCVEIVTDGPEHFICDVGTGARPLGQSKIARYGVPNPQVYHLFISHLHWDHLMGIPFFTPIYIPGNRIIIHGCHSGLEEAFRLQMRAPNFPVDYTQAGADIEFDLMTPDKPHYIAGLNVTPKKQLHAGRFLRLPLRKPGADRRLLDRLGTPAGRPGRTRASSSNFSPKPIWSSSMPCIRWPRPSRSRPTGATPATWSASSCARQRRPGGWPSSTTSHP